MRNVYIIGAKGIPARYGGFETFVEKLTEYKKSSNIQYHVASLRNNTETSQEHDRFRHNDADVFVIDVPEIGSAKAVMYDVKALRFAIKDAKANNYENPIFYVLTSRIGPFIAKLKKEIENIGGILLLNPDGNEWKRQKWSLPVRKYWKMSERSMIKRTDLVIADNPKIEDYIHEEYQLSDMSTTYIPYGTDTTMSNLTQDDAQVQDWYSKFQIQQGQYFLIVGRFVPENNYEVMIREFLKSKTKKDLVIITNVAVNAFYNKLVKETGFDKDSRIKFVGTVYDQNLLKFIRKNAYAYLHGHEVGGTNPSLLEAMATTSVNLLIDVGFNRAVAKNAALYWTKRSGSLSNILDEVDNSSVHERAAMGVNAKQRIEEEFNWSKVVAQYEEIFLNYEQLQKK